MAQRHFLRSAAIVAFATAAIASTALLSACGSNDSTSTSTESEAVTISQPWVKAAPSEMTAGFAELVNSSDHDVRLVAASSDVAKSVELHEVVESAGATTMRPKAGGFVIPAKGSVTLVPGGEHFMFMGLTKPVRSGDTVKIDVRFADGSTATVDALARDFDGNQENYKPGAAGEHS